MTTPTLNYVVDAADTLPDDAPWVVLSNSLGSTLAMWDRTVPALAEVARVLRYDTRGHGGSEVIDAPATMDDLAGDLLALMDRLDIERAHLVGLSLGGSTVLRAAQLQPQRVRSAAVLCSAAYFGPAEGWQARASLVREKGTEAVADAVVARWYTAAFAQAE
uniref:alpha/beta fold hydrolase n=1 Tax=Kribbia dieselivorans TaxID=331526 RepID=UPI000B0C60E3